MLSLNLARWIQLCSGFYLINKFDTEATDGNVFSSEVHL